MTSEPYRVEYDVTFVTYLENGGELSGADFAQLWATTRMFGKHRGIGAFWQTDTVGSTKQRKIELGSMEPVQPLLDRGAQPIFGGASFFKTHVARFSTIDADLDYAHSEASRCFGYETLPYLQMTVSGQWFEGIGPEVVIDNMREHFEVADKYSPPYGLIDVSAAEDCYGGIAYTPIFFSIVGYIATSNKQIGFTPVRRDATRLAASIGGTILAPVSSIVSVARSSSSTAIAIRHDFPTASRTREFGNFSTASLSACVWIPSVVSPARPLTEPQAATYFGSFANSECTEY
jgi:hypothetical protein